ncbi:hypothetical protein BDF20DRAFT_911899 [Mycotypha africana]|uniref:uncharacterized protein n=1 Tax=Mycotypha africana TaxID=64632 RepID=UPI0023012AB1|nr:uncharacterized protein BDF20DRAFT_911899 [Mycotypha africana]KAI8981626.1 hypothetical protein BDF20DRAFT_911899 [Mycotypha africana]
MKKPPQPPSTQPHFRREFFHGLDYLRRREEEERKRRARAAAFAGRAFTASDSGHSAMPASTPASAPAAAASSTFASSVVRPKNRSPVVSRVLGRSISSGSGSAVLVAEKPTFASSVSQQSCWSHAASRSAASSAVTAPAIVAADEAPVMVQPEVYRLPSFPSVAVAIDVHESSPQTLVSSYKYFGSLAKGFRRSGLPLMLCLWLHRNRLSSDRCARVLARKGKLARRNRMHQRSISKDDVMDWEFTGPCTEIHFPSGSPMMIDEDYTSSDYFSSCSVGCNSHAVSHEIAVDIIYEEDIIMEVASHSLAGHDSTVTTASWPLISVKNTDTAVVVVDASSAASSSINSLTVNDVCPTAVSTSSCSAEVRATAVATLDASVDCPESESAPHCPGDQGASATVASSSSSAPVLRECLVRSLDPVASSNSVSLKETMTTITAAASSSSASTSLAADSSVQQRVIAVPRFRKSARKTPTTTTITTATTAVAAATATNTTTTTTITSASSTTTTATTLSAGNSTANAASDDDDDDEDMIAELARVIDLQFEKEL